jgi:RNA polymerase sigma-70 factor (ECF subfamily)
MEQALAQVPVQHREILLLYNGNDFTFEEIASILDISVNTVKSRYRRALGHLRKVITHPNVPVERI